MRTYILENDNIIILGYLQKKNILIQTKYTIYDIHKQHIIFKNRVSCFCIYF